MSPSGKEEKKKKAFLPPEPLCLFCLPEDAAVVRGKTYVNALRAEGRGEKSEGFWAKKRTEARIRRRRMKEPVRNLRSFFLTSVKDERKGPEPRLPSLFEVLETVKDAWPSPSSRKISFRRDEDPVEPQNKAVVEPKMKDENAGLHFPSHLLNRRLSMPEELMRKYSVKERTSEESETNKTAVEVSPSSSSTLETARRKETDRTETNADKQPKKADACQQTSDSEDGKPKKTDRPTRVLQSDYYRQGQRILRVKGCTCPEGRPSSTTASAKEETEESGTPSSLPSSSPTQLPKRESSSGNLSSESDNLRCTCAELSSKETSTDLYLSGKSTLSQTVSDKSMSTQDSTVSINSVSTRGSTVSDNSNSTTPEIERTSAKETTTSPDYSPRTPRNRKNRRRDKKPDTYYEHGKNCPKHSTYLSVGHHKQCPVHTETSTKQSADAATNTDQREEPKPQKPNNEVAESVQNQTEDAKPQDPYKWAKLTQEELYMMQQLRHRKLVETRRQLSQPTPSTPDTASVTGSAYVETQNLEQPLMIPRYSALPRTLSMLVNTSSADTSHNSDSDSLADSLEDQPVTHVHKLYFDTKKESKPVRGDASVLQETKQRERQPRGRAFFVSIKEPFGEDELLENIQKIPQPPDRIKNQIFERHLNLCTKHKLLHKPDEQRRKTEPNQKKKKPTHKNDSEKTPKSKKPEESKKKCSERTKRSEEQKPKTDDGARGKKDPKSRYNSKIPVLVSSHSGSSSPEREAEKPQRPKIRVKRPKDETPGMETTQILEITQTGAELSLQKPQAVIHPSQAPFEPKPDPSPPIPSLLSAPRLPALKQPWNKQVLIAQARRSPIGKFRQRFEVIPEEKSSSLSSAEEKTQPKCADASTSPVPTDGIQFHSYNVNEVPNLIVAKITNKQLETLPYVKGSDTQKIILFSSKPQNCNSSKGRDALIAMNREDFNRLAKGWMNFYKLSENPENSENEEEKREPVKQNKTKEKTDAGPQPELADSIRLDCSNTILRSLKSFEDSGRDLKKQNSLPELKPPPQKTCEVHKSTSFGSLPKVCKHLEDDDTDSDSTDYMEPPSPRVPPLPIDDVPSDGTLSSSDGELKPQPTSLKYLQFKKRGLNKPGLKKGGSFETSRLGKKKNSGWSVTVAGTVELSRSAPDLEMRLSFPANGGPPVVSQSDSGFADDSNYSKLSESLQDLDSYVSKQELPTSGNLKQKWMVTVKNPKKGEKPDLQKQCPNPNPLLPDLELPTSRNPKKVLKFSEIRLPPESPLEAEEGATPTLITVCVRQDVHLEERVKRLVEKKMRAIWPKVQKVIKKEFLTESGRLITECEDIDDGSCLSVRGNAVSMERKQKPPTMTERDVTRRYTSRTNE